MPRIARAVTKGYPHHVTQRGNYRQTVFELDEAHLYAAIRYVEKNPVSAKIVRSPENYKWSSAKGRIHKRSDPVLSEDCYLTKRIEDWRGYLMEKEDARLVNDIRKNSLTGRPCGSDALFGR